MDKKTFFSHVSRIAEGNEIKGRKISSAIAKMYGLDPNEVSKIPYTGNDKEYADSLYGKFTDEMDKWHMEQGESTGDKYSDSGFRTAPGRGYPGMSPESASRENNLDNMADIIHAIKKSGK